LGLAEVKRKKDKGEEEKEKRAGENKSESK